MDSHNEEDTEWQLMTAKLNAYRVIHTHMAIHISGHLGAWIAKQRSALRCGRLAAEKKRSLEDAGVVLVLNSQQILDANWLQSFADLKDFLIVSCGKYPIQQSADVRERTIARWVNEQRTRKESMACERHRLLSEMHFIWSSHEAQWLQSLNDLQAFLKSNNSEYPSTHSKNKETLRIARWISTQRTNEDIMPHDRHAILEASGFVWGIDFQDQWTQRLEELKAFIDSNGKYPLPRSIDSKEKILGNWVNSQRRNLNRMTNDRRYLLQKIHFVWAESSNHV